MAQIYLPILSLLLFRQSIVHKSIIKLSICIKSTFVSLPHDRVPVVGYSIVDQISQKLWHNIRRHNSQWPKWQHGQWIQLLRDSKYRIGFDICAISCYEYDGTDIVGIPTM